MASAKAIFPLAVALLSCAAVLQGCGGGGGGGDTGSTISDLAKKNKDLSTLVTALEAADLVSTLEGKGPFTVFAPTDAAFKELPKAELAYLLHTKGKLQEVLEYHVHSGSVSSSDLKDGEQVPMLKGGNVSITIDKKDNKTTVKVNDATVTTPNVKASNGVVHVIDKVLIPSDFSAPNIPALATAANLSTLVTALKAASLADTLSGAGPFTVFAPTNDAFAALPEGVLKALLEPANVKDLTTVLTYHVANGELFAADLKDGQHIKTLEGQNVNITISGSEVSVKGETKAKVTKADVCAVNGVVHVIDTVLLPPGFVPPFSSIEAKAAPEQKVTKEVIV
jgi:transforming growth factor-beta-induced protein